jgi:hypothetical protein
MANYILVPLNPRDQVEQIIPRIEEVVQTGMTVIFLTPYQANGFFKNRRIRAGLSAKGMLTDGKALKKYSYEEQTRLADARISVARERLHGQGVDVIAYVYKDSLGSLLKCYRRNGGIHLVQIRRRKAVSMREILQRIVALFSVSKRSSSFPYSYYCQKI